MQTPDGTGEKIFVDWIEDATEPRNFDFKTAFPLNLRQIKG
jgi:hypothetical protein